jgi:AAA15 family ATPase/GTPase
MGDNNPCTAEESMLRDLKIQNYRTFNDFHVDNLARVNLIVGTNNSGKTSLLEAVYLLVNQDNPECLLNLLSKRGEIVQTSRSSIWQRRLYQIRHIFHTHQISLENKICIQYQEEISLSIQIHLRSIAQPEQNKSVEEIDSDIIFYKRYVNLYLQK